MPKAAAKKPTKKSKYIYPSSTQRLTMLTTSPDRGDEALQPSTDGMPSASFCVENQPGKIVTLISELFESFD